MSKKKILFYGTPEFALPSLERLLAADLQIAAVITQPDRPAGRGVKLTPPPVKVFALERGLTVLQPERLKSMRREESGKLTAEHPAIKDFVSALDALGPIDASICVAYGSIIPTSLLYLGAHGMINVHPSLLPRWRGAAPLQRAIFAGDTTTGVSIMSLDEGLDTGPVTLKREVPLSEDTDYSSLHDRLSLAGAELLIQTLPDIMSGELRPTPQDDSGVTYAEKWTVEDAGLVWSEPAQTSLRRIRASCPEPGARTTLRGEAVKIYRAHEISAFKPSGAPHPPGAVAQVSRSEIIVSAGQGQYISIDEMQFPGKRRLPVSEILRGKQLEPGDLFI